MGSPKVFGVAPASTYCQRGVMTAVPNETVLGLMRCTFIRCAPFYCLMFDVNTLTGNCGVRELTCSLLARRGPCLRVEEYTPKGGTSPDFLDFFCNTFASASRRYGHDAAAVNESNGDLTTTMHKVWGCGGN